MHLPGVIKYLSRIEAAIEKHGAPEVRRMAAATMQLALSPLGPVLSGSLAGGTAFGTTVSIDYWLVGPALLTNESAPSPDDDHATTPSGDM